MVKTSRGPLGRIRPAERIQSPVHEKRVNRSIDMENITITVPVGTQNHSDPHLLCVPAGVDDVLKFFIVNYIAHAFTVIMPPGATTFERAVIVLMALFLPATGAL